MIHADGPHYLVPRRLVHAVLASALLLTLFVALTVYALAGQWLPAMASMLDAEAPLASPDAVVLSSNGRSQTAERAARDLVLNGGADAIVLLGEPFSPDRLAPAEESRRLRSLISRGVPRSKIVELYEGQELWDSLETLRAASVQHGWRRVLLLSGYGSSRRTLLAARSVLGAEGIEVGQSLYSDDVEDMAPWWEDAQMRGHVLYNWILLLFGRLVGRY